MPFYYIRHQNVHHQVNLYFYQQLRTLVYKLVLCDLLSYFSVVLGPTPIIKDNGILGERHRFAYINGFQAFRNTSTSAWLLKNSCASAIKNTLHSKNFLSIFWVDTQPCPVGNSWHETSIALYKLRVHLRLHKGLKDEDQWW